jgi:uncharacterized protein (TIGR00369 family)
MSATATIAADTGTALDGLPRPPCAELLDWRMLEADIEAGWVRIAFEGSRQFLNPAGFIQGGFLAAMLDDSMGPAVFTMTRGALYTATIDMHVSYLAPARPGPYIGAGRVVQLGKTVAFLEASLTDADGTVVARATSAARLVAAAKALA